MDGIRVCFCDVLVGQKKEKNRWEGIRMMVVGVSEKTEGALCVIGTGSDVTSSFRSLHPHHSGHSSRHRGHSRQAVQALANVYT